MSTDQLIALIKALGPTVVAMGSAVWIVVTYLRHQREARIEHLEQAEKDNKTRMFEARKPFNDKQLAVYSNVSQVTGELVTITDLDSPEWKQNITRFYQLFWTELSMVEDQPVKDAMEEFSAQLQEIVKSDAEHGAALADFQELQQRAYRLASALRASIAASWAVNLANDSNS